MLKIYANGESGDIIWDGYFPDIIDELATANVAVIRAIGENNEQVAELTSQLVRQIKEELTPTQFIRRS